MIQIYAISIGLSGLIDGMPHKLFRSREHLKENIEVVFLIWID